MDNRTAASETASALDNPKLLAGLVELSESFIYHCLDGQADACARLFADDGLWLSPLVGRTDRSVEGFRRFCEALSDGGYRIVVSHLHLDAAVQSSGRRWLVSARCFIYVGAGGEERSIIARPVRIDFFWQRAADGRFRIASLSAGLLLEDATSDQQSEDPLNTDVQTTTSRLEVRDRSGATHFIDEDEIVYFEADGRHTIVHTRGDSLFVQGNIGELESAVSDRFVRLHRTYLVNGWQVKSLSGRGAVMADGTVLPVPARRLVAIRNELNALRKPQRLSLADLEAALRASLETT